jgi:hypothetical protein
MDVLRLHIPKKRPRPTALVLERQAIEHQIDLVREGIEHKPQIGTAGAIGNEHRS